MTGVSIKLEKKGEGCWCCGATKKLTLAHVIPKWLNPKRNAKIVLCVKCHYLNDLRFNFQRQLRDTIHTLREVARAYPKSLCPMECCKQMATKAKDAKSE